ncbi:hypothetical protein B0T16DRAFT_461188 [Cercophora newfieldiana]|uniref:BTB domain-containing protein n=1 Tax=Cercophora newfieldiana TaxID=92897 RepID=A0AA39XWV0_9PEZI|nr:hypothetical protein B0T16DRAFT_461188 [Cercophora newfieldiana]
MSTPADPPSDPSSDQSSDPSSVTISGNSTDTFVLVCGKSRFPVNKDAIRNASTVISDKLSKANITEQDMSGYRREAVACLADYLSTGTYNAAQGSFEPIRVHAKIFALAEHYGIPKLKGYACVKYGNEASECDAGEVLKFIADVYTSSVRSSKLRQALVDAFHRKVNKAAQDSVQLEAKPDVKDLIDHVFRYETPEAQDFRDDFLKKLMETPALIYASMPPKRSVSQAFPSEDGEENLRNTRARRDNGDMASSHRAGSPDLGLVLGASQGGVSSQRSVRLNDWMEGGVDEEEYSDPATSRKHDYRAAEE